MTVPVHLGRVVVSVGRVVVPVELGRVVVPVDVGRVVVPVEVVSVDVGLVVVPVTVSVGVVLVSVGVVAVSVGVVAVSVGVPVVVVSVGVVVSAGAAEAVGPAVPGLSAPARAPAGISQIPDAIVAISSRRRQRPGPRQLDRTGHTLPAGLTRALRFGTSVVQG